MANSAAIQRELEKSRQQRAAFIELVRAEEQHAQRNPRGYRRKVFGLVALAYSYIFGVLVFAIALVGVLIYLMIEIGHGNSALIKLVFVGGIFVLAVLRSLWVKISPPDGVVLSRKEAPELYREVLEIADRLRAPRPKDIRLDYQLNAAACQTPRLGMFGFYRNTLLLGLPLLLSLSRDEARAVIAHEFGHFSGAHGKFGAWSYRVNQIWQQLGDYFSSGVHGAWLFVGFVNWFQPKFAATTFALRRANEYEADKAAAEVAGASNIARGLMRLTYLQPHLNQTFWDQLPDRIKESRSPIEHVFGALPAAARLRPEPSLARRMLESALAEKTDYDDTHPSLSDRLTALGESPESIDRALEGLEPPARSAAEALFQEGLPHVIGRVEVLFSAEVRQSWAQAYDDHQQAVKDLAELRAKAEANPLTEEEQVDLAFCTLRTDDNAGAEEQFRRLIEAYPDNPLVHFGLGQILADKEDPSAEPMLRFAMERNPVLTEVALGKLAKLHQRLGEHEKLVGLREEAVDRLQTIEIVEASARTLQINDHFEPHGLSVGQLTDLRRDLGLVPRLQVAYLVKKVLPDGQRRMVLIAFHEKKVFDSEDSASNLVKDLVKLTSLPDETLVSSPAARMRWMERLNSLQGAMVYGKNTDRQPV